jgi:hypothetical protein
LETPTLSSNVVSSQFAMSKLALMCAVIPASIRHQMLLRIPDGDHLESTAGRDG